MLLNSFLFENDALVYLIRCAVKDERFVFGAPSYALAKLYTFSFFATRSIPIPIVPKKILRSSLKVIFLHGMAMSMDVTPVRHARHSMSEDEENTPPQRAKAASQVLFFSLHDSCH